MTFNVLREASSFSDSDPSRFPISEIKPIVLCGGSGTRLWPASRESLPKQFVPLIDGNSLFSLTLKRIEKFSSPICIANEEHRFFVKDLLSQSLQSNSEKIPSIFLEPSGRNTAAAMASAVLMPTIKHSDLLLFLPSDHYIPDIDAFIKTIELGVDSALAGYIVTFGIQPSFPSTAYGYIQRGDSLDSYCSNSLSTFKVKKFIEKPPLNFAQDMLLSGDYFWNAGIFLCQTSVLIDALTKYAPDIMKSCEDAINVAKHDGDFIRPGRDDFLACRSESIDYAVMEHFEKVAVVPFKSAWSDIGSWNAVSRMFDSDELGNRVSGQGFFIQSANTFINAPHRPVIALGISNLIIIDTPDAVLVASENKVEEVKDVVQKLKNEGVAQAFLHRRVARPWGWYDPLVVGDCFQVKHISVKPGASLSLQMHRHRTEHWIIVRGIAKVTNGDNVFLLSENQSTYIPIGVKHRLENPGLLNLEIIEVQSGNYLGEDDIVRFEDAYGRS